MSEPIATPRITLRALPLPAKLVVTCFLMAVGLGYSSAMVQLHMQDSRSGKPMPTVADVVAKFTGKRWHESALPRQVSQLEKLIVGPVEGVPFNGIGSMAPVFFHKDAGNYTRLTKGASPQLKAKIDAEREGERIALQIWINLPAEKRQQFYDSDRLIIDPAEKAPKSITAKYAGNQNKIADGIRVKTLLHDRCVRCHGPEGAQAQFPLETLAQLEGYMEVPAGVTVPEGGGWVKVEEPISLEKLTQSTHAHMLSFAMLFSLTGLVFAFTGYPAAIRCVFGPLALVAVTADVCLWWLARQCDQWGPYFAMGVLGTGGTVALALGIQIVFSLFNLYGKVGKVVLLAMFAGAAACGGLVFVNQIAPGLEKKAAAIQAAQQPKPDAIVPGPDKTPPKDVQPKDLPPTSRLERLLSGEFNPMKNFNGNANGGMVRALFDKDEEFAKATPAVRAELTEKRKSEQALILFWVQAEPEKRKVAYETDKFPLPMALKGRPFTQEFKVDDQTVRIKSLIDARCVRCHGPEKKQEDYPLTKYSEFEEYFKPDAKE